MIVQNGDTEMSEKGIEEILGEASGQQKKQMDAEGIFASEELIAATMQKLGQTEGNAMQQAEKENWLGRWNDRKQLGRIAMAAAAALVIVLATGSGIRMLYNSGDSKGYDMDGEGMPPSSENTADDSKLDGFYQDSAFYPEALPTEQLNQMDDTVSVYGWDAGQEAEEYLFDGEEISFAPLAEGTGIKPQLLYEGRACSALKIINKNEEALQIVFDYPQDFLYACGREDRCFYLLATRKLPSGGYEHQLLSFDFAVGEVKTVLLPEETAGLIGWISLQDGSVAYEYEE